MKRHLLIATFALLGAACAADRAEDDREALATESASPTTAAPGDYAQEIPEIEAPPAPPKPAPQPAETATADSPTPPLEEVEGAPAPSDSQGPPS